MKSFVVRIDLMITEEFAHRVLSVQKHINRSEAIRFILDDMRHLTYDQANTLLTDIMLMDKEQ